MPRNFLRCSLRSFFVVLPFSDLAVEPLPTSSRGLPLVVRCAAALAPDSTGPHAADLASPTSTKARMAAGGDTAASKPNPAPARVSNCGLMIDKPGLANTPFTLIGD